MECKFVVGQKVVCIAQLTAGLWAAYPIAPIKGQVYTVREIESRSDPIGLRLCEITLPYWPFPCGATEGCFHHACFRPLQERKTDIGIFQRMLQPDKELV